MIKINGLYKIYENGSIAVRNVSLQLPSFGFIAIVGTSGCGKSTLLNLISRNDIPSKGELLYNDIAYRNYDKSILIKDFTCIYQDFKLIENLTVYQNIKIGHELSNKDIDNDFILNVAEKLGLTELLDQKVFALSGGQQQRVAIARALVRNPRVIFADEPTGNLDASNSENVYNILKDISKDILVVIVSHDKAISKWADRIIEMDNGKVIGDYSCEQFAKIEAEKSLQEAELPKADILNTDIEYKQKSVSKKDVKNKTYNNKQTKIGTKSNFSYTKGRNLTRKNQSLTARSTMGLMFAFNNNGLGKKITLLILSALMIMLIFWTTAVMFTSPDVTFCKFIKENKMPFVEMNIYSRNYTLNNEEFDKILDYITAETGQSPTAVSGQNLHYAISDIVPVQGYNFSFSLGLWQSIFLDNPEDMGIKMLIGSAPKTNAEGQDEIAISKTYYDYFMKVGKFKNINGEVVDFSKRELIGTYIEEFKFKITGVFEDYNDLDMENNNMEGFDLYHYNSMVYNIIRPKVAYEEAKNLNANFFINLNNFVYDYGINSGYFVFGKNNSLMQKYYYNTAELKEPLAENEIYVTDNFASDFWWARKEELKVGDTLTFDLVKINMDMGFRNIEKVLNSNLTFKVKGIIDSMDGTYEIIMNENVYDKLMVSSYNGSKEFIINSKFITPRFIKKFRKFVYNELTPEIKEIVQNDWQHQQFSVDFASPKLVINDEYYNDVLDIARFYIGLPLCILSTIAYTIILCVLMSDLVKEKGKDTLILRSLGAKNTDIWKIFGAVMLAMLLFQFVIGCSLGGGLVHGLNLFWMLAADMEFYTPTFFISPASVFVMLIAIFAISGGVLFYNINKLDGKNLRQAFQKQKR